MGSVGFSIMTWDEHWQFLSETEKRELIDLSSPWADLEFTKIRTLLIIISSLSSTKKIEQIKEIRTYYVSRFGCDNELSSDRESLLFDILDAAKTYGTPLDIYDTLTEIGKYYDEYVYKGDGYKNLSERDYRKALHYFREAYLMMDTCLQEYKQKRHPIAGEYELYFGGPCRLLIRLFIKDAQLDESIRLEQDVLNKGFMDAQKDELELSYFRVLRLMKQTEKWKAEAGVVPSEKELCIIANSHPEYAAELYKAIGNVYYDRKDFLKAKENYEKARSCCPSICGITRKLGRIDKILINSQSISEIENN